MIMRRVPARYKCLLPHTRADATKMKPATPTPSRWYPVRSATSVKGSLNHRAKVIVLAASKGERVDAIKDIRHSIRRIESRFHSGQFCNHYLDTSFCHSNDIRTKGSLGSSLGWGTRIISPCFFSVLDVSLCCPSSSNTLTVPVYYQSVVMLSTEVRRDSPGTFPSRGSRIPKPISDAWSSVATGKLLELRYSRA